MPFQFPAIEIFLLIASVLLLLSVASSKVSDRFGIPSLLLFLLVGMLAGSEGIGGIHFNDPWLAKSLGVVALIFILFAGGIETKFRDIRPILWEGVVLSTAGVLVTAVLVSAFAMAVLKFSLWEGFLLGAIISSTDAATVLTILRSKNVSLRGKLRPLLELESGSNDPMAVFLTLAAIRFLTIENVSFADLALAFVLDMSVGLLMGFAMSRVILFVINRLQLDYEGLYPVLTIALVVLTYALTTVLKGNGFLAVYVSALILSNSEFLHKKAIIQFHEGLAWMMQIVMFLALGLLVFPSRIIPVIGVGLLISVFLMAVARPLSVFLCLAFSRLQINEKAMLSWVGLRGAVPIILATFPLIEKIPQADTIFNIVFFTVLTSILLQGTSIPAVSRWLKVDAPFVNKRIYPIEIDSSTSGIDANLEDVIVPFESDVIGKRLFQVGVPENCLVVLICRDEKFLIPNGKTELQGGDVLLTLGNKEDISALQKALARLPSDDE
ncbi:MAG: potassium/proton antiporter [Candidatus Omnitrophota bacterium]|nr:potassium/proton antiporter [Candidatus Omnitrophota bacterium]MDZ4241877.1 potassium/proton antiporter [Candidatus Omnitrophota bacterium]